MKFVDIVNLTIISGKGGSGRVGFRREKYLPRGGPDGGDGGRGGHVVFRINTQKNSLLDYRFCKKMEAADGLPGGPAHCTGADGANLVIEIPPGTVIKSSRGTFDLGSKGEVVFLRGGRGGRGNYRFRNSINQTPNHAQVGESGESEQVTLELKAIADIGIIGFPNAGKSTLISRISAARPKIANYPFTTIKPNLGVVDLGDGESFVVADIPGLVEGAAQGRGMGNQFLRHIERTGFFIHMIDISGFSGREPLDDYKKINQELRVRDDQRKAEEENFLGDLALRRQIVVLNKIDSISQNHCEEIAALFQIQGIEVRMISAVTGQGVGELVNEMAQILRKDKLHGQ